MRFSLCFLAALAVSCATATYVVQQYPGPARPPETIATLRVDGNDTVRVLTLDGDNVAAPIASDARIHVEMLPARHTLIAQNADGPAAPLAFEAEAGKVYRVVGDMRVFEVDRGSDTPLRDVTQTRGAE
jgi:hypothetical protein